MACDKQTWVAANKRIMSKLFSVFTDKVPFFINFNLDEQTFKNYDYLIATIKVEKRVNAKITEL